VNCLNFTKILQFQGISLETRCIFDEMSTSYTMAFKLTASSLPAITVTIDSCRVRKSLYPKNKFDECLFSNGYVGHLPVTLTSLVDIFWKFEITRRK
jgi:hypothetical protein